MPFSASIMLRSEKKALHALKRIDMAEFWPQRLTGYEHLGLEKGSRNTRHHSDAQQRSRSLDKHPQELCEEFLEAPRSSIRPGHFYTLAHEAVDLFRCSTDGQKQRSQSHQQYNH